MSPRAGHGYSKRRPVAVLISPDDLAEMEETLDALYRIIDNAKEVVVLRICHRRDVYH